MHKKLLAILLSVGMLTSSLYVGADSADKGVDSTTAYALAADVTEGNTVASGGAVTPTPAPTVTPEPVQAPTEPKVTGIKGGSKRVKLYWNKVTGASGYYIYYSTSQNGIYTRTKTITDPSTVKYVKKSLTQNMTYYFKISSYIDTQDGRRIEGAANTIYTATTGAVASTSKGAKKYSTWAKFKKSPAYKKYSILKKANSTRSFAIPGQKTTNVAGFANNRMFPQAGCVAGAYMLVSAYAYNGEDESVIYVVSRSSKSYITTLVMPDKTKINAMACDGERVWVTQGKKIAYFSYETVSKAVAAGTAYTELTAFDGVYELPSSSSLMAYRDGVLWIGAYNATSATKLNGYVLGKDALGEPTLTAKYSMAIPNRTKAVAFDDDGYMYLTRSSQSNNKQSGYLSQIRVYKPNFASPSSKGSVAKNAYVKKVTLPPRASGSMVYGAYLYTVFSGARYSKCSYKVDRVIAVKRANLR